MAPWLFPACAYGKAQLKYYRLIRRLSWNMEAMAGWRSGNDIASGAGDLGFAFRAD